MGTTTESPPPVTKAVERVSRSLLYRFFRTSWSRRRLAIVFDEMANAMREMPDQALTGNLAHFLNWATGPTGFSARSGLWMNSPFSVEHRPGGVAIRLVNERIVELPYAFSALHHLPSGGSVLDFGAGESTLALSLASLGFRTTALDLRAYPFQHPNLEVVTTRAEEWVGPREPLDAIFSISALEHVGLEAYGQGDEVQIDLDIKLMERFRQWLTPTGILVFTAPYGRWSVDGFQRTYDDARLRRLLADWKVRDKRFALARENQWECVARERCVDAMENHDREVVMLIASPKK